MKACKADVIEENGFSNSEENIDEVMDCGGDVLDQLEDCTDRDWRIIRNAVRDTLKLKNLEPATGEEISELLETGQVEFEELTDEQRKVVTDYEDSDEW